MPATACEARRPHRLTRLSPSSASRISSRGRPPLAPRRGSCGQAVAVPTPVRSAERRQTRSASGRERLRRRRDERPGKPRPGRARIRLQTPGAAPQVVNTASDVRRDYRKAPESAPLIRGKVHRSDRIMQYSAPVPCPLTLPPRPRFRAREREPPWATHVPARTHVLEGDAEDPYHRRRSHKTNSVSRRRSFRRPDRPRTDAMPQEK